MNFLSGRNMSVNQRYNLSLIAGTITAVVLSIATGYFRQYVFDHAIFLVLVALCIALVIQKIGRGVQTRFAITALLLTLLSIIISDVVAQFGLSGLLDLRAYEVVFNFFIHEDIFSLLWIVYRALALYIAYIYSRVV